MVDWIGYVAHDWGIVWTILFFLAALMYLYNVRENLRKGDTFWVFAYGSLGIYMAIEAFRGVMYFLV